jgi:hypothetical protein
MPASGHEPSTISAFEPLRESTFANVRTVGRDDFVAFFGSMGWLDALPEAVPCSRR